MAELFDDGSLRDFVEESREHIVSLNRDLLEIEDKGRGAAPELVNNAFRAIHTIKGLSGMLGFGAINGLSHGMEDVLDEVRGGGLDFAGGVSQAFFDALDALAAMVEAAVAGGSGDGEGDGGGDGDDVLARLVSAAFEAGRGGTTVYRVGLSLARDFKRSRKRMLSALDTLDTSDALGDVVSVAPPDAREKLSSRRKLAGFKVEVVVRTELSADELRARLGAPGADVERVERVERVECVERVEASETARGATEKSGGVVPPSAAPSVPSVAEAVPGFGPASQAIRVDVEKLDRILTLVGELVILRSRYHHLARQAIADLAKANVASRNVISLQSELNEVESAMSRTLSELQDAVMKARLVPLSSVFGRFHRAIRDLAAQSGKTVRFESSGGETELDKKVMDRIGDPLMHLVRNAVDHGVESPAQRRGLGKPEEGCVRLVASQEGDKVVIEIADDGRGLDRERIIAKAVERGVLAPEKAADVDERGLLEIISAPGLSTSSEVTEMSGRGVGMDVVHEALAGLKGTLELATTRGEGTTFKIKLPLTMAIVDSLLVAVGGETYAIAVRSVKEILSLGEADVHRIGERECFRANGRVLPLVRLGSALGSRASVGGSVGGSAHTTVVVDSGGGEVGLMVDRVIGQQEIVIKALSRRFEEVKDISGGSVLGDGSVCLIIDVPSLVSRAMESMEALTA